MSEPGPPITVACPHCGGRAQYRSWFSAYIMGARLWSDGRRVAFGSPEIPELARCPHCGRCYWLEDAARDERAAPREDESPPWLPPPTEEDCYRALDQGLGDTPEREKRLRLRAWHRHNDALRGVVLDSLGLPEIAHPRACPCGRWRDNLEALVPLLAAEVAEEERLLAAEALRELGRFEEARALLESLREPRLARIRDLLLARCRARDAQLFELPARGEEEAGAPR